MNTNPGVRPDVRRAGLAGYRPARQLDHLATFQRVRTGRQPRQRSIAVTEGGGVVRGVPAVPLGQPLAQPRAGRLRLALTRHGDHLPAHPVFPGGVGKTQSANDFLSPIDDVERKLFKRLPDDTWVYPGHGYDITLGTERRHLPEWRSRGW